MTVYLDVVLLLNFLVDFLLLLGTNRLMGHPLEPGKCALGRFWEVFTQEPLCFPGSGFWEAGCGGW